MIITHDPLLQLSHQLRGSRVTTVGPCARKGCSNHARGGGSCADCLTADLGRIIGAEKANALHEAMRRAQVLFWEAEEAISAARQRQQARGHA